jgi:hypothetical protein
MRPFHKRRDPQPDQDRPSRNISHEVTTITAELIAGNLNT